MEENSEKKNYNYSPVAIIGLTVALLAGVAEILSGFGNRWGVWDYRTGFVILRWAAYCGGAAGIISLLGCIVARPGSKRRGLILSFIGLLMGITVMGIPWSYWQRARHVPAIHDITTNTDNPPRFVAIVPLRKSGINTAQYGGPEIAAQQRKAYPDIVPLELPLPPLQAFKQATNIARSLGWQLVEVNEPEGRIEATDTTFWFGFKDDIVVRITATDRGSRIDVRSVSRLGKSDLGTNAKRIRGYLTKLREMG